MDDKLNKQLDKATGIIGAGMLTALFVGGFASLFGCKVLTLIAGAIGGLVGCMFEANKY